LWCYGFFLFLIFFFFYPPQQLFISMIFYTTEWYTPTFWLFLSLTFTWTVANTSGMVFEIKQFGYFLYLRWRKLPIPSSIYENITERDIRRMLDDVHQDFYCVMISLIVVPLCIQLDSILKWGRCTLSCTENDLSLRNRSVTFFIVFVQQLCAYSLALRTWAWRVKVMRKAMPVRTGRSHASGASSAPQAGHDAATTAVMEGLEIEGNDMMANPSAVHLGAGSVGVPGSLSGAASVRASANSLGLGMGVPGDDSASSYSSTDDEDEPWIRKSIKPVRRDSLLSITEAGDLGVLRKPKTPVGASKLSIATARSGRDSVSDDGEEIEMQVPSRGRRGSGGGGVGDGDTDADASAEEDVEPTGDVGSVNLSDLSPTSSVEDLTNVTSVNINGHTRNGHIGDDSSGLPRSPRVARKPRVVVTTKKYTKNAERQRRVKSVIMPDDPRLSILGQISPHWKEYLLGMSFVILYVVGNVMKDGISILCATRNIDKCRYLWHD
jgi:hypothetical protein